MFKSRFSEIVRQTDITRLVVAAIEEKDWEILPDPANSPTEAPTDFHVNQSVSNW